MFNYCTQRQKNDKLSLWLTAVQKNIDIMFCLKTIKITKIFKGHYLHYNLSIFTIK